MLTPTALATLVASVDEAALAVASGVSRKTLNRIKSQSTMPNYARAQRIEAEAKRLQQIAKRAQAKTIQQAA